MILFLNLSIAVIFGSGTYLILRPSLFKKLIGLGMIAQAINLCLFLMSTLTEGQAPLILPAEQQLSKTAADPFPQALILTAIVIGFGMQAFLTALWVRQRKQLRQEDIA